MKKTAALLLVLSVLLLAACQDEASETKKAPESTTVPEPTAAVEVASVEEASPEVPEATETAEPAMAPTAMPTEETASDGVLPRVEPLDECFIAMPEGANYECLYVTVPEFHNEENGSSIKLGVVRLLSTADTPAAPLFFAAGGPGGSVMDQPPMIAQELLDGEASVYADLLATRDLVIFTQRGTPFAEPALLCSQETIAPYAAVLFAGTSAEEREQVEIDFYKACVNEYKEAGIDFAAYNSLENAADVNTIREALGYDQIVLYGESYGTLLAQHVMRDYPDMLAAVILDGVVPISAPSWDTQLDARFQSALDYVIGLCAADEGCNQAYPNLAEDVEAVYEKLQSEPFTLDVGGTPYAFDGNLAAWAFNTILYSPESANSLPLMVDNLLNVTQDPRNSLLVFALFPFTVSDLISFPMHFAVVCSEDPVTSLDEATSLDKVNSLVSDFMQADASRYLEMCSYLNLPVLPDETDAPINSAVPVLLLNGAHDPATPAFAAQAILAPLANSFSFEFPYGGHVQFLAGDACVESIVAAFIADPTTEPDGSCIAEILPMQFELPAEQ